MGGWLLLLGCEDKSLNQRMWCISTRCSLGPSLAVPLNCARLCHLWSCAKCFRRRGICRRRVEGKLGAPCGHVGGVYDLLYNLELVVD